MAGSCSLLSLPRELILQTLDYNHPSTVLKVALTCSTLYRQCQHVLERHRDAYDKHRVASDLSPETVVNLLKDTATARIERWHVRELEIWGSRDTWQDWRPWAPKLPGPYGLAEDEEPSRSALDAQEVQRYIRKGIEWWEFSGNDISEVQQNLELGSDAYLKLLLIASCPRLHSIRFVKREHDTWTSLHSIGKAIRWSKALNSRLPVAIWKWPPGFWSLRSLAVGISTGLLPRKEKVLRLQNIFEELFHIPHLKDLYFKGVSEPNQDEVEDGYGFPFGTSSIKNLFLDSPYDAGLDFLSDVASAPKDLQTIAIRARVPTALSLIDVNYFVSDLARKSPRLQRLVFYNGEGLGGDRCSMYCPEELEDFTAIKQITIAAEDIELGGYSIADPVFADMLDEWIEEAFPHSMEAMYIWGKTDIFPHQSEIDAYGTSGTLDLMLAHLIKSGAYRNLKVIYVENAERAHRQPDREVLRRRPIVAGRKELAFQMTLAAGKKAGVHVCTLMNKDDDGGYWKNFPAKPDRFDLKTSPCAGERPEDWKLNLYTGERGPDCRGCGECKECLVVYPPELWKKNNISKA
ncbi:hypothetical protein FLONG3_10403 [Fusarium longipes]|uniref:F-box domain-containing protein n=1 Tax=Fusarium longipes TaxID=694270 RepID=A0A395RP07_9HYPO|nr:hypothetical protein FLONG3_10403 [Fusarium longipes]